ncbi:MAG: ABC transporter substrate-binding protein [Candidatus Thermoplasmatota archaeon]|nr:ABC transporter substrate-binding protein [Candidatus Thermoplasmatota archaeon]MCL6002354.1 ABC transporter substrate-binding protein [Candidatus Thermoplasmatota archaeon]
MTSDQRNNQPSMSDPAPTPPKKQGLSNSKWYVIIVVLIVIIAALGVLAFYHPTPTVPVGTSADITAASAVAQYNVPYNVSIKTNGMFNSIDFYWGDGSPQVIPYSGSDFVNVSHTYTAPGSYYLYYTVNYKASVFTSNKQIVPVSVSAASTTLPDTSSYGDIALQSASASPLVNNTWIYSPGTIVSLLLGYFTPPANSSYQVVSQAITVMFNGSVAASFVLPYFFNASSGLYELPLSSAIYNLTVNQGYYQVGISTYTASVNATTGAVNSSQGLFKTSYYLDIPVFTNAATYTSAVNSVTLVNAEAQTGGYKTLDPAIQYDIVSYEVLLNTMITLVGYNGSSSSQFFPYLAAYMPTIANGGINDNWANYTVKINSTEAGYSGSYRVTIQPYENYTFHIRSNATFQDGSKVTAWDVAFTFARLLLLDAGSPGTPGWINAQYLLPGNYYASNTFWNITQNITWDNATNNVTFHFQSPLAPSLVYEILGDTSGAQILDAAWVQEHGGGIGWNTSGFAAYPAHGSAGDYITYLINHVMASGPYMIEYTVPASEVVLIANPNYNPPGNGWEPKPKITTVVIEYMGQETTRYLQLKSGYASIAGISAADWYIVQGLQSSKIVNVFSFPTLTIYFYGMNANINETMLSDQYPQANVPQTLFDSIQVRRAFADSYDYSYYLAKQIGNEVYNTTFGTGYAGTLPYGMVGYQSNQTLVAAGVSLPEFNLAYAEQNWTAFENSALFSAMGLVLSPTGTVLYRGSPLNIPIFVLTADPQDVAGASTWIGNLEKVIPGLASNIVTVSLPNLIGFLATGQNPMPVYLAFWAPDYPYPTDYIVPIAWPSTSSFYTSANAFYPSWFNSSSNPLSGLPGMVQQYNNLTLMDNAFVNGTKTGNQALSLQNFHALNEMLVNMSMYVYLYQANGFWIVNTHINPSTISDYQENVMMGSGGDMMYNYLSFT